MANVENPYNTTLQNNLVVTSGINVVDLVTINFIATSNPIGGTMTISPTQVQIQRGTSLNDNNIVLNIVRPDIRIFYYVKISKNSGSDSIYDYNTFLDYKFFEDETLCYFYDVEIGKRYYVSIIGTKYNAETSGYYEFSEEYSFEYITENPKNDIIVQRNMNLEYSYNYTDPSCTIKYYVIRLNNNDGSHYESNGYFRLTIPIGYKIVDAVINNMSYGFTEAAGSSYGIEILAIRETSNKKEIDMNLTGDGTTNEHIALQISKI